MRRMTKLWQDIINFFINNGWKIIAVASLIILGVIAIRLICRSLRRVFIRRHIDEIVSTFIVTVVNVILIIVLIVAVFDIMGISVAPFVAVLGTAGLALALSIQDSLSNVASGIVIIITKPFKKGDYVDIGGIAGSVDSIHMLTTHLITPDNKKIIMPNNKVAKSEITNFSMQDNRRVDFRFNVAYGSDIDSVKKVIDKVIKRHELILEDPLPQIRLIEHGSSSLVFVTRIWVKTPDYWSVFFDIQEQVYKAFRDNNIEIPYNKLDVNILNSDKKIQ